MLLLTVLGPLHVALDGNPLHFRTNKAQALLIYLAVAAATQPAAHRREALMELLWPGLPLLSAQDNLRQTLYQLRKALPTVPSRTGGEPVPLLLADRQTVQLNPDGAYELDVATFQRLLRGDPPPTTLAQALTLYRGDFLADVYLADSDAFEAWAAAQRATLRRQALDALDRLTATLLAQRAYDQAEVYARRQIEIDDLCEGAYRQLMLALARHGHRRQALAQYAAWRQLVADELGVEPSAETVALYERIRDQAPDMQPQALEKGAAAATPESAPAVRLSRSLRHNLPAPSMSFVGREAELAAIAQRLADPSCRLVTLIGPGGIGKSRLALQAASDLMQSGDEQFRDGVYLVRLAAVPSMEHLIPAIAAAIGFAFAGARDPSAQLIAFLQAKTMLLVLDNMERLTHAATSIADLLQAAPGLKVVVTSRVRLNLYEEWLIELPGLGAPAHATVDDVACYDAIKLFVQRARQVAPDFSLAADTPSVVQVCRLCAGMPLGIELAASWVKAYSCAEIAAQIQDNLDFLSTTLQNIPERQRSLRATFEHSWQPLTLNEQQVFARLSVFSGGFTAEAAGFVCGASTQELARLVDKSLLQRSVNRRFEMHPLLQQYAAGKLSEAALFQAKHARFFATFHHQHEAALVNGEVTAIAAVAAELDNVRAAWQWGLDHLDEAALNQLLGTIVTYYELQGWFEEGRTTCSQASQVIKSAQAQPNLRLLGRFEEYLARFYDHLGEYLQAQKHAERSLGLFEQIGEPDNAARARSVLGFALAGLGDNLEAERHLQQSLRTFAASNNLRGEAETFYYLSFIATGLGDLPKGLRCVQESLNRYQQLGDQRNTANCLFLLGNYQIGFGDYAQALAYYQQSKMQHQGLGNRVGIADCLRNEGLAALRLGCLDEAERVAQASVNLFTEFGDQSGMAGNLDNLGLIAAQRGDYRQSRHYLEQSLAHFQATGNPLRTRLTHSYLGNVMTKLGDLETAKTHFRQALELGRETQAVLQVLDGITQMTDFLAQQGLTSLAVKALAHIAHHPSTDAYVRDQAKQKLSDLSTTLAETTFTDLKQQGCASSMEELVATLLNAL
jgi:predicted ATPase/DNA-binding SARP family transcriptional activator